MLLGTQHLNQLIVNDLDDHLRRIDGLQNFGPNGLGLDPLDEAFDNRQRHIRLKQGDAHFPQGFRDIRLGQCAALGETT